ncbi:branched-chain amino acid ABC transporter permease [Aeromicrobium panaciterrae]|uniref:branched-chain amino acid ABC transporter permease n=1 Tax=Aeromicrobium panaciterrae TaxID=363861 RepID=UPI0031CE6066
MQFFRTHTLARHAALAVIALVALVLLTYALPSFRNFQLATVGAYLCATAGLTVLIGQTGQLSLGHGALMATGAYSFALMANQLGENGSTGFLLVIVPLLVAIVVAAIVGGLIGLAGARLAGPYLAGLTLALIIAIPTITTTWDGTLGGDQGLSVYVEPAPASLGASFPLEQWQAWIACAAAVLVMFLLANLVHSRFGRAMRAVRDDEVAARLCGIAVGRTKVVAFIVSAATAGLGGGILAMQTQSVSPGAYSLSFSLFLVMGVVVGGVGHLAGAVWGSLLLVALPDLTSSLLDHVDFSASAASKLDGNLALLIFGLVLIFVIVTAPRGLQGLVDVIRGKVRRTPGGQALATVPSTTTAHPQSTESSDV